jgi:hypothetical protein
MDEQSTQAIPEQMTLTLIKPISIGSGPNAVEYRDLLLTEPSVGELKKASKAGNSIEVLAALISLNAKVPMSVVDQMKQRDLDKAGDFFALFGNESPQTPTTLPQS